MICMEGDFMKRMICNVIMPGMLIGLIVLVCYPVCMKEDGFDFFQFWILTGFLFGVRKMNLILLPKNFGIGESMGIFVLNIILGGIIGGVVLCFLIVKIFMELILVLLETFGQKVQK